MQGYAANGKDNTSKKIHWLQTMINAQGKPQRHSDFVYKSLQNQMMTNHVIVWDTSASTLRNKAASKAKGIILKLFEQAYINRQRIGLLEFSADKVSVVMPCQRVNRDLIVPKVSLLEIGGNTPVTSALLEAGLMLKQAQKNQPNALAKLTLITDGLFKELPVKPDFNAEFVIIDINRSNLKIGACDVLATAWGAQLINSTDLI